jgi:methylated-DNA-[protein]-cysteine S-methyltransferase
MEINSGYSVRYHCLYQSPIGLLHLVSDGSALIGLTFVDNQTEPSIVDERGAGPFPQAVEQLDRYFQGKLQEFDVPILFHGTEFQIRVWNELRNIPFGETVSYKAQAARVGSVARAVGLANGRNPISIIVPCHRVIGATGRLVGYGGGLDRKRKLLQFEAMVKDFGPQELVSG